LNRLSCETDILYDPVSQTRPKATDEESVRQEMIKTLVGEYGYPLTSTETEFRLKPGSAAKKADRNPFRSGAGGAAAKSIPTQDGGPPLENRREPEASVTASSAPPPSSARA
jgi:hypothetical protein